MDMGKRKLLPGSQGVDLRGHPAGAPLVSELTKGFMYSDAWVDDARLVVLNAMDAAERGADIRTRTRDEWAALFAGGENCFAPVLSMEEAAAHPHNVARGTFVEVDGVRQPAPAPRMSKTPAVRG